MDPSPLWLHVIVVAVQFGLIVVAATLIRRSGHQHLVWPLTAVLATWAALVGILAVVGVFEPPEDVVRPLIAIPLVLPLIAGLIAWRRLPGLRALVVAIPIPWLIGFQAYRILGVLFLIQWSRGFLPPIFALPAGIGDVVTGLAAIPLAVAIASRGIAATRRRARLWNWFGLADLAVAVTLGFFTAPTPLQLVALDQPNDQITAFPLALVPTFAVPFSILLHLATLWRLRNEDAAGGADPAQSEAQHIT